VSCMERGGGAAEMLPQNQSNIIFIWLETKLNRLRIVCAP